MSWCVKSHSLYRFLSLCFLLSVSSGCSHYRLSTSAAADSCLVASLAEHIHPAGSQLLVTIGEEGRPSHARLYLLQREGRSWKVIQGPFDASVGRNGFAPKGQKREGDGRSPSGLFPLEFVFGYAPESATRMPYRQATENDVWVDDPASPDYNTWVRKSETSAASFELMRLPDSRYRHGVVIGYNRNPIVKGKGSAIFLHSWLEPGQPTAGCVALDEEQLVGIINWLDPRLKPEILMGTIPELAEK